MPFGMKPGAAPRKPMEQPSESFEDIFARELDRERQALTQAGGVQQPSQLPAAAQVAPPAQPDVVDVDFESVGPIVAQQIRNRRKQMGPKGVTQAGGYVHLDKEPGQPQQRYDTYGKLVQRGFQPSRGKPRWFNALRYSLENVYQPGLHQTTSRQNIMREGQAQRAQETEQTRQYQNAMLGMREADLGLQRESMQNRLVLAEQDMWSRAHTRAQDILANQEDRRMRLDYQTEMKRLQVQGQKDYTALDPLEQQRFDFLEQIKQEDPELYKRLMVSDVSKGKLDASGRPTTKKGLPTVQQAQSAVERLSQRIAEIQGNLSPLEAEATGAGTGFMPWNWGMFNLANNESVPYTVGDEERMAPAGAVDFVLQQEQMNLGFLMDMKKRYEHFLSTDQWLEGAVHLGDSGGGMLGSGQEAPRDYEGEFEAGYDTPPGVSVLDSAPPEDRLPGGWEPESPGVGVLGNQRSPMPPAEQLSGMSFLLQQAYQLMAENPMLTNEQALEMSRDFIEKKQGPPMQDPEAGQNFMPLNP